MRHPSCRFPLLSAGAAFDLIREAVRTRSPYSFVRAGDGEGLILSLGAESWIADIHYLSRYFGDSEVPYSGLVGLRDALGQALANADLVGVREDVLGCAADAHLLAGPPQALERAVKATFPLRPVDRELPPEACRRLALLSKTLSEIEFAPETAFTSAWAHWDFVTSGDLYRLMSGQRQIGLITSRSELPAMIQGLFSVEVAAYPVPDRYNTATIKEPGSHFPRRFAELRSQLRVSFPGMVFLVGAGPCGKVYCQWIKAQGGIAIDIGAVMDTWLGIPSRPAVLAHKYAGTTRPGQVPQSLLLERRSIQANIREAPEMSQPAEPTTLCIADQDGIAHDVHPIERWGIRFYMLDAASFWLPVIRDGSWEQAQRDYFLNGLAARGATLGIDIGANNGIYTLLMGRVAGLTRIVAFEPCEPHFSLMCEAVRLNGLAQHCELHRLALSDETARKPMYVFPDRTPSLNQLAETQIKSPEELTRLQATLKEVDTRRLDDVLAIEGERIAIKIDTEGHELKVIRGAERLLTRNRCFVQVESFDDSLLGPLAELGYRPIHRIRNDWYFDNLPPKAGTEGSTRRGPLGWLADRLRRHP
jgi:FkbM family methyltransferase